MRHYCKSLAFAGMLWVAGSLHAQEPVRPYDQWEATQFVAVTVRQPEDYVRLDNNWEILYNLRTPRTLDELRTAGVECSDSQWMLLRVAGLIQRTPDKKWKTTMPMLDKEQAASLRDLSEEIARSIYGKTKADFASLAEAIDEMGFAGNKLSLVFSYLLDGRMWTKLTLFEDIDNNLGWSGCYWALYEPREGSKFGTNGFGEQDLILTYIHSDIAPANELMDRCAEELARSGKVTDARLIARLKPYGMVDGDGNPLFPVIKQADDRFHQLTDKLVDAISSELKANCGSLKTRYGIDKENVAMVVLYHEVMWDLMDLLIQDRVIAVPAILNDATANQGRLNEVLFFVKGGLMQ